MHVIVLHTVTEGAVKTAGRSGGRGTGSDGRRTSDCHAPGRHGKLIKNDVPGDSNPPGGRKIDIVALRVGGSPQMYALTGPVIHLGENRSCWYEPNICNQRP